MPNFKQRATRAGEVKLNQAPQQMGEERDASDQKVVAAELNRDLPTQNRASDKRSMHSPEGIRLTEDARPGKLTNARAEQEELNGDANLEFLL